MRYVLLISALALGAATGADKPRRNFLAELKSGGEVVRAQAALLLKSDPKAVAALLQTLRQDKSDEVKLWAAFALGELKDRAAAPDLIAFLKSVPEARSRTYFVAGKKDSRPGDIVRRNVCWALGQIGDAKAIDAILVEVRKAKDWQIRYYAALSLGKIGDPRALAVLNDVAKTDGFKRDWERTYIVREQAKRAIAMIEKQAKGR